MLTPNDLDELSLTLVEHSQRLEVDTINTIVKGISNNKLDDDIVYLIDGMKELGYNPDKIRAEVMSGLNSSAKYKLKSAEQKRIVEKDLNILFAKYNKDKDKIIAKSVADASGKIMKAEKVTYAAGGFALKNTAVSKQLVDAIVKQVGEVTEGAVKTAAFRASNGKITPVKKLYQKELDYALTSVASGLKTYDEAVADTVKTLSKSGLRTIDYASGMSFQLETAVRNGVQTAYSQLAARVTQSNIEEMGVEYVEVSRSLAPRPSHAEWEGKVYTLKEFEKACHYGEFDNPEAIYSYNCHHMHYPFFKGLSQPMEKVIPYPDKTIGGKKYTGFEITQKQRNMERDIRKLKTEKTALKAAGQSTEDISNKIKGKTNAYYTFSKATEVKPKPKRLSVVS